MSFSGKIASSGFGTTPESNLATTDIYNSDPSAKPLTAIADFSSDLSKEMVTAGQWLGSKDGILSIIGSMTTTSSGKFTVDAKALSKRLIDASGGASSPIIDLMKTTQTKLLKSMGLPDEIAEANDLKKAINQAGQNIRKNLENTVLYNGVKTIVDQAKDVENTKDLLALLNNTVETEGLVATLYDVSPKLAIFKSVLDFAAEYAIPDVIDGVLAQVADDKEKRKLLLDSLNTFITNSDLRGIRKVYEQVGRGAMLSRNPKLASDIIRYFKIPSQTKANDYQTLSNTLVGLLNDVQPGWYTYNRNGTQIPNLEPLTNLSPAAKTILSIHPTLKPLVMIAPTYRSQSILTLAKNLYPRTGL